MKNKKIIFYIDMMYRGGAQRVMSILLEHFLLSGHEVILVNDFPAENSSLEYSVSPDIKRLYLKNDNNGNVILKNLTRIIKLRKIIKEDKPDVVLSFLGRPNLRMLVASFGLKTKKVVSVRNDPEKEYGINPLKKIITNILFSLADGCVFQTEAATKYFWNSIQKKSKIIFNPVDDKFYKLNSIKNRHNIVTVGRLEIQKNQKLLISAYAEVVKKYPKENLLIYGAGPLMEELQSYVDDLQLTNKVQFKGNVDNIEKELKKTKIFVLSSDYEGMPNALMEAMASGVAVISTDCPCGGPRILIKNKKQGFLVPCNDKDALANAIIKMLKKDFVEIGKNARLRSEEFRTDKILKKWENYLLK